MILCFTLSLRGRHSLQLLEWRFDERYFQLVAQANQFPPQPPRRELREKYCRIPFREGKPRGAYSPLENDLYVKTVKIFMVCGHLVLGLASGLEAFSRKPPCGSIGALAVRRTPETRGTAWEFLSYYPILPSRYLRDPFTFPVKEI